MPGVVGIISQEPPEDCRRRLAAMVRSMCHEPSYEFATCEAPQMGVYAGVVAHPGSFGATESGANPGGAIDLVLAGEYFGEPRGSLLQRYEQAGESAIVELNGLFSGLIIDRRHSRALLFNDRYGVERVYVHQDEHATSFASEAKALLCVLPSTRAFDDEGVAQFLTFGCPIEGRTLFRGIRLLEGGSLWTFEGRSCRKRAYFTASEWESQPALSAEDFQSEFESTFKRALPRYVAGESRIGISLTGGLDTRMIMACLPALSPPPICYTFAGLQGKTLDVRIAERVASECGLEHQVLRIAPDFLSNFASYVDRTVYATDGCAGSGAAHEIYLNAQATQLAQMRLTGNFGSEILRSMSTFKRMALSPELLAPDFQASVNGVVAKVASSDGRFPITFAAFREIPWNLFGLMAAAKSQLTFRTPYLDNDIVALTYRAPTTVRESSASALALVHDADPRLSKIPTDRAVIADGNGFTYTMRRILAELTFKLDYMHKEAPPPGLMTFLAALDKRGLLGQHKWLPYRLWFQNELAPQVLEVLTDPETLRLPFFNRRFLQTVAHDHVQGRSNYVRDINVAWTLSAVDRLLVGGDGWD